MLATVAQENLRTIGAKCHMSQMQTWTILLRIFKTKQMIENKLAQLEEH